VNAGLSFALNRHFTPFELGNERMLLSERLSELLTGVDAVLEKTGSAALEPVRSSLEATRKSLGQLPSDQ
jgi:hypothetical protein